MTKKVTAQMESKQHFTVMSHDSVMKAMLMFYSIVPNEVSVPPGASISEEKLKQQLRSLRFVHGVVHGGPFSASKMPEESVSSIDMSILGPLLSIYLTSLNDCDEARSLSVSQLSQMVPKVSMYDLDAGRNVPIEPSTAPLVLVKKWTQPVDTSFDVRVMHQARVGPKNEYRADGVVCLVNQGKLDEEYLPAVLLERHGGIWSGKSSPNSYM